MQHNINPVSSSTSPLSANKDGLFTSMPPTVSSQITGGHWYHHNSADFSAPPRLHSYGHGRLPAYSHAIAAQRLNDALFA